IECDVGGNGGADRSNVGRAAGDDHIESQRNCRSVKLDLVADRAREHHRKLVGALANRLRDLHYLPLHTVTVHALQIRCAAEGRLVREKENPAHSLFPETMADALRLTWT